MNPELQTQLANLLKEFQSGKDVLVQNFPAIAKEYLAYSWKIDVLWCWITGFVVLLGIVMVIYNLIYGDYDKEFGVGAGILISVSSGIAMMVFVSDMIEIAYAPKVYIIHWIASMVK